MWERGGEQVPAFAELCSAEVLQRSDPELPYILTTDWSQKGMGAVLSQVESLVKERPVCYASRTCNPAEKTYGSCEGECLAVNMGNSAFQGVSFRFTFHACDRSRASEMVDENK